MRVLNRGAFLPLCRDPSMDWGPDIRRKAPVVLCFDEQDMAVQVSKTFPFAGLAFCYYLRFVVQVAIVLLHQIIYTWHLLH